MKISLFYFCPVFKNLKLSINKTQFQNPQLSNIILKQSKNENFTSIFIHIHFFVNQWNKITQNSHSIDKTL